MKAKKDPKIFLKHILESIGEIEKNIHEMSGVKFFSSTTIQDAVVRRLEIIGEAVKNLPAETKSKHPEIPWKQISGMRDVLIHEYAGVSLKRVWKVITDDLSPLKETALKILKNLKE